MSQEKEYLRKKGGGCARTRSPFFGCRATRAEQNSSASEGRRPEPRGSRKAAPETPRARRKRPSLKAAAAAGSPAHKGRPPRARPGSPPSRPPSSPRRSAGLHSRGLTHGGGVALRGSGAARFRPRFRFLAPPGLGRHDLPPAPAPWPAPAAAPPAPRCPRLDPAFIWLTAPFSFAPTGKPKQSEPRRRGKETESRKGGGGAW